MRHGLLVLGIVSSVGLCCAWLPSACEQASSGALTPDARLAIDVRCPDEDSRESRECRGMLKKLFLAGALDPDRTLRAYCESVRNMRWQGTQTTPPKVCLDRYDGW